ncbi:MAG: restriction endonuclease [Chloroflexi bacterium]|nr:restriction endonuclease [Chloroflexota bacterium]
MSRLAGDRFRISKSGRSWIVEGDGRGWVYKRTFPTRWKAKLAVDVFKKGGRVSDYFRLAKLGRKGATRSPLWGGLPGNRSRNKEFRKLWARIDADPNDADAYLELAEQLIYKSHGFSSLKSRTNKAWEKMSYTRNLTHKLSEAMDHLTTALALSLSSDLESAKARYLLISLLLSELANGRQIGLAAIKKNPRITSLAADALKGLTRHLNLDPHDILALRMQKALYEVLQDTEGVGKTEQAIAETSRLLKAGLIKRARKKSKPYRGQTSAKGRGIAFEARVEKMLKAMDLQTINQKSSADGGIDIVAYSEAPIFAGKYMIQCKDWQKPVGEPIIRDLYGVVLAEGANKGILVTTGSFTRSAERFAKGKPIELIDGRKLRALERG